jgi:hypothetical protein
MACNITQVSRFASNLTAGCTLTKEVPKIMVCMRMDVRVKFY